jgi:type IV pilus assembly protein PilM
MFSLRDLFSKSNKGKKIVGLDIGSTIIKLVELADTPKGYRLRNFTQIPLQQGVIKNGIIVNQAILTEKIKELLKISNCSSRNIVTALSGHSVIVKKASFGKMEDEELRERIIDDAGEYMPFDSGSEVDFDFYVSGEGDMSPNQINVVIAAAKREIVRSYRSAIEKAGCKVVIMDVDSFAIETAYEENYDFEIDDVVALLNIGASITNINIVKGGESSFVRNILMGGNIITEALQKKLEISFEEAEDIKLRCMNGEAENDTKEELVGYAGPIFEEIERSISYFSSMLGGSYIQKILVSGGCAILPGIIDALKEKLRCEVEILDPFKKIAYSKKTFSKDYIEEISPFAAIGVGLAIRRIDDK